MSIDLRTVTGGIGELAGGGPSGPRKMEGKSAQENAASDSLALTDTVTRLMQAEQALSTGDVIDTERVARVASALQQGTYEIDAERIAEKLMELDARLPEKPSGDG